MHEIKANTTNTSVRLFIEGPLGTKKRAFNGQIWSNLGSKINEGASYYKPRNKIGIGIRVRSMRPHMTQSINQSITTFYAEFQIIHVGANLSRKWSVTTSHPPCLTCTAHEERL